MRVESPTRERVLATVATEVEARLGPSIVRVGVDGVDGAGKTTFADELAERIRDADVIRASVDSFHHPRRVRYARGKNSPLGYFEDSFDYATLKTVLLDPLSPGGDRRYRRRAFDHTIDRPVDAPVEIARVPGVLLFDGIFLHRPELASFWDYSVFLDVSTRVSIERCLIRAGFAAAAIDPDDPTQRRYVRGQEIYLQRHQPRKLATRVVQNDDLAQPEFA